MRGGKAESAREARGATRAIFILNSSASRGTLPPPYPPAGGRLDTAGHCFIDRSMRAKPAARVGSGGREAKGGLHSWPPPRPL